MEREMEELTQLLYRKKSNALEWFLPFFPVLSQYTFGFLNLGIVGLVIIVLINIYKTNLRATFPKQWKSFFAFFAYIVVRDIIRLLSGQDVLTTQINRMLEYLFVAAVVFLVSSKEINFESLYKWFKIAGGIYIVGTLYHAVMITIFHRTVTWISIIPGYVLAERTINFNRPLSFFVEPAGIVLGLIFLLAFSLQRKDYKWAIITSLGMLASTSTVAVSITIFAWSVAMLGTGLSWKKKALIMILFAVMLFLFFRLDIFGDASAKFEAALGGGSTVGSRLIGGYEVVSTLSPLELIFGSNYNDVISYMADRSAKFSTSSVALLYYRVQGAVFLNTLANIILHYGIIGVFFFYKPIIKLVKIKKIRILVTCFIVISLGQSLLLNSSFFMYLIILLTSMFNIEKPLKHLSWSNS